MNCIYFGAFRGGGGMQPNTNTALALTLAWSLQSPVNNSYLLPSEGLHLPSVSN